MTMMELYTQTQKETSIEEIKKLIRGLALEELAGQDFQVRPVWKTVEPKKKTN